MAFGMSFTVAGSKWISACIRSANSELPKKIYSTNVSSQSFTPLGVNGLAGHMAKDSLHGIYLG